MPGSTNRNVINSSQYAHREWAAAGLLLVELSPSVRLVSSNS